MVNNSSYLITGGTGSFGQEFLRYLLDVVKVKKKIIIFSRDEFKQFEMKKRFCPLKYQNLRYFIGDVRDKNRLDRAFAGVDIIVHAAALKQVDVGEYNPTEFINTNIIGAQNIIEASISHKVKKILALSTDKAAAPINLYGATKLCSDKLFVSSNLYSGKKFQASVVRYGNVFRSRGSVIPLFQKQKNDKYFTITHKDMTRFNISIAEAAKKVFWYLKNSIGGEIFVPKLSSYKILDVAKAINPKNKIRYIGIRPGEKIHEELVTSNDAFNTIEYKNGYIILPTFELHGLKKYISHYKAKPVKENFQYASNSTNKYLSILELKKLIENNLNE
ncbi:UDP-N-acetylglucosamine 4,6-dehydratase (inverting) [Candidatus Pelagibacter sp. Uisw_127]|uniref:UDP-N-acetylglucosamine 4,6-dehydratase (inverting) n=1 Tax=Candidatus Pelagibacter sp. Uisw_127 TaxID=3230988 RepID=UPI0039E7F14C|tara:strand:+ start:17295 stop:18290 length:996 start_codon:yes stop_codon:yes gene_type:complete